MELYFLHTSAFNIIKNKHVKKDLLLFLLSLYKLLKNEHNCLHLSTKLVSYLFQLQQSNLLPCNQYFTISSHLAFINRMLYLTHALETVIHIVTQQKTNTQTNQKFSQSNQDYLITPEENRSLKNILVIMTQRNKSQTVQDMLH